MASSGTATGTVRLWMDEDGWGVIDVPDLPGGCWAEASVVEGTDGSSGLRAGQTVDVDWTTPGPEGYDAKADHVVLRDELQATPGG
jgi:CspA family cold shock protein